MRSGRRLPRSAARSCVARLPIFLALILHNYTAALAVSMVLSSTVAIIESKIVRARDEEAQSATEVPAGA